MANVIIWFVVVIASITTLQMHFESVKKEKISRHRSNALRKMHMVVDSHIDALASKRRQMVYTDAYGIEIMDKWIKEVDSFICRLVIPKLNSIERESLSDQNDIYLDIFFKSLDASVSRRVNLIDANLENGGAKNINSPLELEKWCAIQLNKMGGRAETTIASGDQGADVIATLSGRKIVVQCKLYGRPVGNKAVQEAFSAKVHYGASVAAVLSTSGYTKSAYQLAETTGVMLLSDSDLLVLPAILSEGERA